MRPPSGRPHSGWLATAAAPGARPRIDCIRIEPRQGITSHISAKESFELWAKVLDGVKGQTALCLYGEPAGGDRRWR
jgi:hypothetical protein